MVLITSLLPFWMTKTETLLRRDEGEMPSFPPSHSTLSFQFCPYITTDRHPQHISLLWDDRESQVSTCTTEVWFLQVEFFYPSGSFPLNEREAFCTAASLLCQNQIKQTVSCAGAIQDELQTGEHEATYSHPESHAAAAATAIQDR